MVRVEEEKGDEMNNKVWLALVALIVDGLDIFFLKKGEYGFTNFIFCDRPAHKLANKSQVPLG